MSPQGKRLAVIDRLKFSAYHCSVVVHTVTLLASTKAISLDSMKDSRLMVSLAVRRCYSNWFCYQTLSLDLPVVLSAKILNLPLIVEWQWRSSVACYLSWLPMECGSNGLNCFALSTVLPYNELSVIMWKTFSSLEIGLNYNGDRGSKQCRVSDR